MGFDQKNEQIVNENQLDLFSYETANLDFIPDVKVPPPRPPEANKSPRFMSMSVALHLAAAVAMAVLSVPLVNEIKTETITIDLEEPSIQQVTKGSPVEPTMGGAPAPLPEKLPVKEISEVKEMPAQLPEKAMESSAASSIEQASASEQDAVIAAPIVAKVETPKPAPAPKAKPASAAKTSVQAAPAKTTFKAAAMTVDDINAPELDEGEVADHKSDAKLGEDFNQDFDDIDNKHKAKLAAEESQMNAMAEALSSEQEGSIKDLESQNQLEAAALAENQKNLRQKNAKAVASAIASERAAAAAAAEAAAKAKADKEAATIAAANAAKNGAGNGGEGTGHGAKQGAGAGNNGLDKASSEVAGSAEGVRSLDQLRQMPGNPRPQYSEDERLRGDAGNVTFRAYISKEGVPMNFQMKQSTGYRNLDAKTLAALKKWRFYPGQEGWVEMPFQWDLKGGIQEVKGRLRTSVGQLQNQ